MKTMEMLKSYVAGRASQPAVGGWEWNVWVAAMMLKTAIKERGTERPPCRRNKQSSSMFKQEELFN